MSKFVAGAFGGGGANGGWQAGRLCALKDDGYKFDLLTGTSVGALNALAEACGMSDVLEEIWTTIVTKRVMNESRLFTALSQEAMSHIGLRRERKSLHDSTPLFDYLVELFHGKECLIDYFCSVVIIGNGTPDRYLKHHIAKGDKINLTDLKMVWGSTAIPVVFEEVLVNDMKVYDGGVLQSTPIRDTIRHYPTTDVVGIVCQPFGTLSVELGKGLVGRAAWTINAMLRAQFEREWRDIHNWNQAIKQWKEKVPDESLMIDGISVKYIETDLHAPFKKLGNPLDFNHTKTALDFYAGYNSYNL